MLGFCSRDKLISYFIDVFPVCVYGYYMDCVTVNKNECSDRGKKIYTYLKNIHITRLKR